jgi:hypothetical protein
VQGTWHPPGVGAVTSGIRWARVALHVWHISSVRCVTHLAHLGVPPGVGAVASGIRGALEAFLAVRQAEAGGVELDKRVVRAVRTCALRCVLVKRAR